MAQRPAHVRDLVSRVDAKNFDSLDYDDALAEAYNIFDAHAEDEEENDLKTIMLKLSVEERDVRPFSASCFALD